MRIFDRLLFVLESSQPRGPPAIKWIELVGMDGAKAVEIIKKETGNPFME